MQKKLNIHNADQVFLSDRQVAARYSISRQTPWLWLKQNRAFPRPFIFSKGCTRWRLSDLEKFEESQK